MRIEIARAGQVDGHDGLDGRRTLAHHQHAVGELHGFLDVVRHEEDGLAFALPDAREVRAHLQARDEVQRAKRFVHVDDVRVGGERAGDFDPLLHAAGQFARIGPLEAAQADHLDVVRDNPGPLGVRLLEQAEPDVVLHGEPRKDAVLLKDENAPRVRAVDGLAFDHDVPARGREEAGQDVQQRRFATARRADDDDELAFAHLEVHAFEHVDAFAGLFAGKAHPQIAHLNGWLGGKVQN